MMLQRIFYDTNVSNFSNCFLVDMEDESSLKLKKKMTVVAANEMSK
jgi:hypothetical protein